MIPENRIPTVEQLEQQIAALQDELSRERAWNAQAHAASEDEINDLRQQNMALEDRCNDLEARVINLEARVYGG